jgi:phosphohistidine phosphatase SixA
VSGHRCFIILTAPARGRQKPRPAAQDMMRTRQWVVLAALALAIAPGARADPGLLEAMRAGGHLLLVRHARADDRAGALVLDAQGKCANERNLNADGRAQALRLQALLERAGVQFDLVLASPFCRARQTAQIAFGRTAVEPNLAPLEFGPREQAQARTGAIVALLANHAGRGNVALVSHRQNILELALEVIEEGEALVARIRPDGDLDVLGRIRP